MKLQRSLHKIIGLLAVPSLILGWLWLSTTYHEISSLQRAEQGVRTIAELWQIADELGEWQADAPAIIDAIELSKDGLEPDLSAQIDAQMLKLAEEKDQRKAMLHVLRTIDMVAENTRLDETLSSEWNPVPILLTENLPRSVYRALLVTFQATRLESRDEINKWDRLSISVAGGHFKSVADRAIAQSRGLDRSLFSDEASAQLISASEDFRSLLLKYQSAAGRAILVALEPESTAPFDSDPVVQAYIQLENRATQYATRLYDAYLAEFHDRQTQLWQLFLVAIGGGLALLLTTFWIAFSLSRSLAQKTEAEFRHEQLHDPLTRLANRSGMVAAMDNAFTNAGINGNDAFGLLCMDLVDFKATNVRYGEAFGDNLLKSVAIDLNNSVGDEEFVARIGGDEFAILSRRAMSLQQLNAFADSLVDVLSRPRMIQGQEIRIAVQIGLVEGNWQSGDAVQWLKNAELALREAKSSQQQTVCIFDDAMRARFDADFALANELRIALEQGQIIPFFQPQIRISDGAVVGFEALARWIDDDGKTIPPGMFLPAAETAGLASEIDRVIRENAMDAMRIWLAQGHPLNHIGLNVRASELEDDDFVDGLNQEADEHSLVSSQIAIEILESVTVDGGNANEIINNVARLAQSGVIMELDDFGTGYAGLSSLRQLSINVVKIDRSFIQDIDQKPELQTLTKALIDLARGIGIKVLAEGVETPEERSWLKANHCNFIQGYLVARPMSFEDATQWLNEYQTVAHDHQGDQVLVD